MRTPAGTVIISPPSRPAAHRAANRDTTLHANRRASISMVTAPGPFAVVAGGASWWSVATTGTNIGVSRSARPPAPPCAMRINAAVRYRAAARPPIRPHLAHRIPRRSVLWLRRSSGAGRQHRPGYPSGPAAPTRQLYGRPYMRTHPFRWFAFCDLGRALQGASATQQLTIELLFDGVCRVSPFSSRASRARNDFAKPRHSLVGLIECEILDSWNPQCVTPSARVTIRA